MLRLQDVSRGAGITNSTVTLSDGVNTGCKRSWNTNNTLKRRTKFKFLPSLSHHPHSKSHRIFPSAKGAAGGVKCYTSASFCIPNSGMFASSRNSTHNLQQIHKSEQLSSCITPSWGAGWNSRNAHSFSAPATASYHYSQHSRNHTKGVYLPGFCFYIKRHWGLPCSDSTANELPGLYPQDWEAPIPSQFCFLSIISTISNALYFSFSPEILWGFSPLFFRLITEWKLGITFLFST